MSLDYKVIEVFTSESVRHHGKPLHEAIVQYVCGLRIAARCMVTRGIGGCFENGEVAAGKIEILSFNMPLKIEIILPAPELDLVLPEIERMVTDGIVVVEDRQIRSHRTSKSFIPRHLKVKDAMTPAPVSVKEAVPVTEVVRILLSSNFNGIPVVDEQNHPVGIITQGDLLTRAGMPIRLGLLGEFDESRIDSLLKAMPNKSAADVMTRPVEVIQQEKYLVEAVNEMLRHSLKRLPVTDHKGQLVGMVARLDVFRSITTETPRWQRLAQQQVVVTEPHVVRDVMRTDIHTVLPDSPIDEVIKVIDSNDIQRVAVVDAEGHFNGIISDKDVLAAFGEHRGLVWDYVISRLSFTEAGRRRKELLERARARTASEVMTTDVISVQDDTPIDEAVRLMIQHSLKRLPVLDNQRLFKGIVSRDSLLRISLTKSNHKP